MLETLPVYSAATAPDPMGKPLGKKRGRKAAVGGSNAKQKVQNSSASKLITEALLESPDRVGMSLAALKKSLAAAGYNVKKNNSRIKLAVKSLVGKGVLVQIKGTGASGSFRLSKKVAPEASEGRGRRPASTKNKKLGLPRDSRPPKSTKPNRGCQKSKTPYSEASGSRKKAQRSKSLQPQKSPAKARVGKAKPRKPRSALPKSKSNSRKTVSKKRAA